MVKSTLTVLNMPRRESFDTYFFYDSSWTFLRKTEMDHIPSLEWVHACVFLQPMPCYTLHQLEKLSHWSFLLGWKENIAREEGDSIHSCVLKNNSLLATINIRWSGGRTLSHNSQNNSTGKSSEQNWWASNPGCPAHIFWEKGSLVHRWCERKE